ncbi:DinB family protein [Armatimonas rosea]|uniref:DinB family protein n=1 Tax=Armatimonas rosea TaxID=685828 RepID=A0A7W9SN77_ARMRO|nr:hypothetical protein [Armatimonas rosea]MBB6049717.1 hypothetical protein [Armatimonas rosea]
MNTKDKTLGSVTRVFRFFQQDIENLPEEVFVKSLGGKARTAADIAYEVRLTNERLCRDLLRQPSTDTPSGWAVAPEELHSKEATRRSFQASAEAVVQILEGMSVEEIEEIVPGVLGEASRADHCRSMIVHLFYHSGQLNFIQTLLGDSEIHWS